MVFVNEIRRMLLKKHQENQEWIQRMTKELIINKEEGNIHCSLSHGLPQYYIRKTNDRKKYYIKKEDIKRKTDLVTKDYCEKIIRLAEKQNLWIDRVLKIMPSRDLHEIYRDEPELRKLISSHLKSSFSQMDEEFIQEWNDVIYTGKSFDESSPEIFTEKGERVRSKSEKIIADKLYRMGIPYRYEFPMYIKGVGTIYPDFTILNVAERKEVVLEHFGKMDDSNYVNHNFMVKITTYEMNGFVVGDNLILTFESSEKPLNTRLLEKKLKKFVRVYR